MDKQIICLTSPSEVENPVSLSGERLGDIPQQMKF